MTDSVLRPMIDRVARGLCAVDNEEWDMIPDAIEDGSAPIKTRAYYRERAAVAIKESTAIELYDALMEASNLIKGTGLTYHRRLDDILSKAAR